MSTISTPLILAVSMTPNPVVAGQTFLLSIQIEECTHNRLKKLKHTKLSEYTHLELKTEKLD